MEGQTKNKTLDSQKIASQLENWAKFTFVGKWSDKGFGTTKIEAGTTIFSIDAWVDNIISIKNSTNV